MLVTNDVSQRLILRSKLFNILIDGVDDTEEHILGEFADNSKAGGRLSVLEDMKLSLRQLG